jgi:MFS family permease
VFVESADRWKILALGTLTNALVVAAPAMALPVLFDEIAADLGLSLVQVGLVWGIGALPGIVAGLLGGAIGDRFGPKRVLILGCILSGLFGLLRGMANGFGTLTAAMFLTGMVMSLIPLNTLKACGELFSRRQLGLASGVLSMGMALGFLLGSMFSATVLSPWLGGWRSALYFSSAISLLLAIPWLFTHPAPEAAAGPAPASIPVSMRQAVVNVLHIRNIVLLGFTLLGFSGCIQGTLGYLPLYLRDLGWNPVSADGALASFHTISMICVIPIALTSDRLGSRKKVLLAAGLTTLLGIGFLSVAQGLLVWAAVLAAGFVRDGFMAVFMTSVIETDGVGTAFAGTATGVTMFFSSLGNLFAPPLGNSLAEFNPGFPFIFWAFLAGLGMVSLLMVKERTTAPIPVYNP